MGDTRLVVRKLYHGTLLLFLALGVIWSGLEFYKLQSHALTLRRTAESSATAYDPDQLVLTRSSYALFDAPPSYFSHSWMDAEMESRLLGSDGRIILTNAQHIEASASQSNPGKIPIPLETPFTLTLQPETDYLFVFKFPRPEIAGEVSLRSTHFLRPYTLPLSGQPGSFGSAEISQHNFRLGLDGNGERTFVLLAPAGTTVTAIPFVREKIPVRVRQLTPYRATIVSPTAGYLETPMVFIPGYSAQVDGNDVEPLHSPEGLVAIPVPAGISNVAIRYPGPPGLKFVGWLATLAFAVGAVALARGPRCDNSSEALQPTGIEASGYWDRRRIAVAVALVIACGAGLLLKTNDSIVPRQGHLKLAVQWPTQPLVPAEPLLVMGKAGAANTLYVIYGDTTFRLGIDVWGKGGPISDPLPLNLIHRYELDLELLGVDHPPSSPTRPELRLSVDGKEVLHVPGPVHAAGKGEYFLGRNPVGASVCSERFTGWLEQLP